MGPAGQSRSGRTLRCTIRYSRHSELLYPLESLSILQFGIASTRESSWLFLASRWRAFPVRAPVVLSTDEFLKVPCRMEVHLRVQHPWLRKVLGVINRDVVGSGLRPRKPNTLDDVQRVTVPSRAADGRHMYRIVKRPLFHADGIDRKGVSFPMADRITHPRQVQIFAVRASIHGNYPGGVVLVFVADHQVTRRLNPLLGVRRLNLEH